jgi:hypothetical protein
MKITEIPNTTIELKAPVFKCDNCLTKRDITPYPNRNGFLMVIAGTMGSGKTSFLISSLTSKKVWRKVFDNIYLIMPPSSRSSLKKNPFKQLKGNHIHDELTYEALCEIDEEIDNREEDSDGDKENNLLIIDDQTQALKLNSIQGLLRHMILNSRHKRLGVIVLTQYLNAIPLAIRKNASDVVLCNQPRNAKELKSIIEEYLGLDKNKGMELLRYCFKRKYDKLIMNLNAANGPEYYRNFNRLVFEPDSKDKTDEA